MGSALMIGWCTTMLWVPRLADKYGRKWIFCGGMAGNLFFFTIMLMTHNVNVMIFVIFCIGALQSIRVSIGFVYFIELMPTKRQTLYGTIWGISECSIYLFATIYFWQISRHWIYFDLVGYVLCLWSTITTLFLPESPRFLVD